MAVKDKMEMKLLLINLILWTRENLRLMKR